MAKDFVLGNMVWRITGKTDDLDDKLTKTEKRIKKVGEVATKAGKKLTTFVTLPLAALGLGALKASSDLAESANAVSVVFGESAEVIDNWGKTADKNAGLSQAAFNSIATVIGAQLKQSGLDIDDVADQTIALTQRAADLASVFNTDVTDAAGALGAALRGESEPARRFAINISDAAITAEALATGLVKSKKEMTDQIKVQARLNLIMKQSVDVQGDFVNTSDSLANRTRILKSEIVNIAAELGDSLVPIAEDVLKVAGDLISGFADLDEGTKELILKLAFMAAAAGPLALLIGKSISAGIAIKGLKAKIIEMNLVSLAGPLGIIALLGAATLAVAAFTSARNKNELNAMAEGLEKIKDATELTNEQLTDFGTIISREISKGNTSLTGLRKRVEDLSDELGISEELILDIGLASGKIVGNYTDQFEQLRKQNEEQENLQIFEEHREKISKSRNKAEKEALDLIKKQEAATDAAADKARIAEEARVNGVIAAQKLATEGFQEDIDLIDRKAALDLLSTEETILAKIAAEENYQNQLLEIGYDGLVNEEGQLDEGDKLLLASLERKKGYNEDYRDATLQTAEEIFEGRESIADQWLENELERIFTADAEEADALEKRRADYEKTAKFYVTAFAGAFESVGEALYNQENAWSALGAAALETLAQIVRALGQQLVAEAAILYAKAFFTAGATIAPALVATGAAAAAFTAAGVISAAAQSFAGGGFVQPVPGSGDTGDQVPASLNPREIVLTEDDAVELLTAIRSGNLGGITVNQYNTLNTDSQKSMERAARQLYPYINREGARLG